MTSREMRASSVALLEPEVEPPVVKRRTPGQESAQGIEVVSISPSHEDHDEFERSLMAPWMLRRALRPEDGMALLRNTRTAPAVVCECDLQPQAWKVLLRQLTALANPPLLIVTSRRPDAQLWAEAFNLGAYDVLAKPFENSEVARVLHSAWARWKDRHADRNPSGSARRVRAVEPAA